MGARHITKSARYDYSYKNKNMFQYKNMFLNPKTDNKNMFLKVGSYRTNFVLVLLYILDFK